MWAFEWMPPITQWWIQPVSRYQLWRFMCSPSILSLAVSCWSSQTGGCSSISIRLLCGRIDLVPIVDGMRVQTSLCHLLDQRYRQTSYALLRLVMLSSGLDVAFVRFVIADRQSKFFVVLIILHILDYKAEDYLICSAEDWGTYSIRPLPIFDCSYNVTWAESYEYVILSPLLISIYSPPHKICTRAGRQVAPFLILYSAKITSISFEFYLFS